MAQLPRPGDSHGNLLWKIAENTFAGGGGGGSSIGSLVLGSTPDRVLQTGPLGQLESGAVTTTELGFLAGATSNIQVQIDALSGGGIVGIESLADATAMWITADEEIGIGTSSPDALFEIQARTPIAGTGTISSSSITVTGSGTAFLTELNVGDSIIANGQTVVVRSVDSDTSLTTANSFSPSLPASTAFTYQLQLQRWSDASGNRLSMVDSQGRISVGAARFASFISVIQDAILNPAEIIRGIVSSLSINATTAANSLPHFGGQFSLFIGNDNTQNWTSSTGIVGLDVGVGTSFDGAVGTITNVVAIAAQLGHFSPGATITNSYLFKENTPGTLGVSTNFAGIALRDRTNATNNTNLLIGTTTIPAGNFSIYNSSAHANYFQGSFGIGTSAPDGTLHVFSGSAGVVTAVTAASQLVVEHSTHAGISILTPNNVNGHIVFGDPDDNVIGQIIYTHSLDAFTFVAGGVSAFQVWATQVSPGVDNAISLGAAGARWTEVFAVASLINTSDAREKHAIDNISGEFARYLVDKITPRSYAWNSEAQRGTHYGFVAQEIEAVINSRGLVANEFAPLHYDHENDRYGLREAELLPFLWRVVQDLSKRVAAIET